MTWFGHKEDEKEGMCVRNDGEKGDTELEMEIWSEN